MPELQHNIQKELENNLKEAEQEEQNKFIREKIKERPVNNKKLIRRSIITAAMAVIFGLISCFTFLVLEPVISRWLYPEEEPKVIVFPEDQEEMSPEEMISGTQFGEHLTDMERAELEAFSSKIILTKEHSKQIYEDMSDFVKECNKSLVTITAVRSNVDWFSSVNESSNQVTGLIIADNGREILILAPYESIKKAQNLTLTFQDDVKVQAEIKGKDAFTNMAVLAVDRSLFTEEFLKDKLKIASLGSSNMSRLLGSPVVALGSPMGSSGSFGYGMVCVTKEKQAEVDMEYKLLQTDILGSENAEGFLFNMQGQVIGVITNDKATKDLKNVISAYGITELKQRIEKMSNGEKFAYLGVTGVDVTKEANAEMHIPQGAYITDLEMNSPAMMVGIHQGDVIVQIEEKQITSYKEYVSALLDCKVNETIDIKVKRQAQNGYKELKFSVVLGEQ